MTTEQLDHLRRIDAHLANLLAIAEKRTPGEWRAEIYPSLSTAYDKGEFEWAGRVSAAFPGAVGSVWLGIGDMGFTGLPGSFEVSADNAACIASCAGNAEAGWKATRAVIKSYYDSGICREWQGYMQSAIEPILAAFPNI